MPPPIVAYKGLLVEVTVFCRVPSTSFSQAPKYTLLIHLCRFRVRSNDGLFWNLFAANSIIKNSQLTRSVTTIWLGILTLFPSTTAFALALGVTNLRGLTLRRNSRFSAKSFFFCRYLCQHSPLIPRIPHGYSFTGLQNVPLPVIILKKL